MAVGTRGTVMEIVKGAQFWTYFKTEHVQLADGLEVG